MPRRPARCTQADLARALRAAASVGGGVTVELTPDGTIRLTPGQAPPTTPAPGRPVEPEREIVL